ncbi:MAG: two-component sensor histidine kinase [Crocinitomix sp.]|jgi:two-component sensor histidine kinase
MDLIYPVITEIYNFKNKVRYAVHVDELIDFQFDIAIPLGLIMNEASLIQ